MMIAAPSGDGPGRSGLSMRSVTYTRRNFESGMKSNGGLYLSYTAFHLQYVTMNITAICNQCARHVVMWCRKPEGAGFA